MKINVGRRNPFDVHAILLKAYSKAFTKLPVAKYAFLPESVEPLNFLTWLFAAGLFVSLVFSLFEQSGVGFVFTVFLEAAMIVTAEIAGLKSIRMQNIDDNLLSKLSDHSGNLRRPIVQLRGAIIYLDSIDNVLSLEEIESCLELIEINKKDIPLGISGFFRHPMVLLLLGMIAFAFNSKIAEGFKSVSIWQSLVNVCALVSLPLFVLLMIHLIRQSNEMSNWKFQRFVRWFRLYRAWEVEC
jgi:hypothetical protein